jgi:hypothetical protein
LQRLSNAHLNGREVRPLAADLKGHY